MMHHIHNSRLVEDQIGRVWYYVTLVSAWSVRWLPTVPNRHDVIK
jgi:hypothetical protein